MHEVFNANNQNWIKDTKWLLALLINEAMLAENEEAELLPEEKVGRMVHAGNLQDIQTAIYAAFSKGTAGDGEQTEDSSEETTEGETQAVQES